MPKIKPYYEDNLVKIYHGDCREIIPQLPKVDLVLTDPPYFIPVQTYVGKRGEGYARRTLGDLSILEGYFETICNQVPTTNTSSYYFFCDAKSYPVFFRVFYPFCKHVRLLIWDKIVSFNGYTWRHQHELILWAEMENTTRIPTGDGDVLRCRGVLQKDRQHPAEKPLGLLMQIIGKYPPDHLVFDPFTGSGSALVAAKQLNRKSIGIEIEEKYCEIAAKRVSQQIIDLKEPQKQ